jgi:hypothetical protein
VILGGRRPRKCSCVSKELKKGNPLEYSGLHGRKRSCAAARRLALEFGICGRMERRQKRVAPIEHRSGWHLLRAKDSKDDVVEFRARDEEKPALHRTIGDLYESTTFRDEANGSWHNGAAPVSRGVSVVDAERNPLKVQVLSSLVPELFPSRPASVLASPRSWRRVTRWSTVACTAASVLALPQEDLLWNSVSAVGWKGDRSGWHLLRAEAGGTY